MSVLSLQSRYVALARHRGPDDPAVRAAQQTWRMARASEVMRKVAADLTEAQRAALACQLVELPPRPAETAETAETA